MQKRNLEFCLKIFCAFQTNPRRNQNSEFSAGGIFDIFDSTAKAKNCVRLESDCRNQALNFTQVSEPVRILLRRACENVDQTFDCSAGFFTLVTDFRAVKVLLED